jgi:type II secretory pathway pseudopilin PulG
MVLLLLGILTRIAVTQFTNFTTDAKTAVTRDKMNAIKNAIVGDARFVAAGKYSKQGYEAHCLAPPTTLTDLTTQPGAGTCASAYDPFTKRGWRGPYISTTDSTYNVDGWGTTVQYFVAGPPARTIRSCGADTVCGNSDDITITY